MIRRGFLFDLLDDVEAAFNWGSINSSPAQLSDDIVELELPGVSKDKISVIAEGNKIVVKGENRRGVKFERSKVYSSAYNLEDVDATMADGLLTIKVPLKEEKKKLPDKKAIEIRGGG